MANIKKENGVYIAELSQKELNTISLLIGDSSDEMVVNLGEDFEGFAYKYDGERYESDYVVTGKESDKLYHEFTRHRTRL